VIALTASLLGYQNVSGNATISGGQTLVFSPALFTTSENKPTTGRFFGTVVVAGTAAPLGGVTVALNGAAAATTGSDGRFDLTLNPDNYVAAYSLIGYYGATQTFLLAAGASVDAGTVALPASARRRPSACRYGFERGGPLERDRAGDRRSLGQHRD